MFRDLPNIRNYTQYEDVEDIVAVVEGTQALIASQNEIFNNMEYIGNFAELYGELLDWLAYKQWGLLRPFSFVSRDLYDLGLYDVALYDGSNDVAAVPDDVFKKYIFWIIRRDQKWFSIPNLITQVSEFCETPRSDIIITITGQNINISVPNSALAIYLQDIINAKALPTPLSYFYSLTIRI
jgi:hypothetical protein